MNEYILYGAGHDGIATLKFLGKENVICFCDKKRSGETIEGIPVIDPESLREKICEGKVVIAVSNPIYLIEISKELTLAGIDYVFWQELAKDIIREEGSCYSDLNKRETFRYNLDYEFIISADRYSDAGSVGSYFWQDLWAARLIYKNKPTVHYDIGSRVDGFITHLLSFGQNVIQIDIRPLEVEVDGYGFVQADATNLNGIDDESLESLSALCSLEHFGLGRYGDDIDPEACFKCFDAIQRVIRKDGIAYISVPIGKEHLEFNAHRVFYPQTIVDSFGKMELLEFSGCYCKEIERNIDIHKYDDWDRRGGERFGLFVFRKK